ncbi:cytochrome P450, partial [Saccharomonospora iraqiensis]|uniref:cytochrome P450 n=1 Tax=Saccharomonospora iraqiensis TaxID=52698 RepID=UPI0005546A0B
GVLRRRPRVLALADRLRFDRHAVRLMRALRSRYGPGPLLLRIPGRPIAVLLDPDDVERVLDRTPSPFTPAAREKRAALGHFQPHAVLASPMPERAPRRRLNERVLEADRAEHHLAPRVREIVRDETTRLLADRTALAWPEFEVAWWRIVRRLVLGDHARDATEVTDELAALRSRGNWAFLLPAARHRREAFRARLAAHLDRAEPGSLAATLADHTRRDAAGRDVLPRIGTGADDLDPYGQVPHWLFAFDAAGMVTLRTLAVLSTHPRDAARAREEAHARPGDAALPFLRACVWETVRLWPTTPVLLRESTTATSWRGTTLTRGTLFVVFAPYFHRAPELVPFPDGFHPRVPPDDTPGATEGAGRWPGVVPFSAGPGRCPGENLVLLVTATMLAEFLRQGRYRVLAPRSLRARGNAHDRLPATLNHYALRFARDPAEGAQATANAG